MDRKQYLELCRLTAAIAPGVGGIKTVPDELKVKYKGYTLYPVAYELTYNKDGTVRHTAVLHELKANAIINADLAKVEEYDGKGK